MSYSNKLMSAECRSRWSVSASISWLSCALVLAGAASARADVVTFHMTGVHWHNTTYIGNTTMPLVLDWYGTGTFTWTYTPGNFQNGHGTLVSLDLPPWGVGPGGYATTTIVDTNGISTTLVQNVDSLTYDIAFNFSPALSNPSQTVNITGGSYQFYPGTYAFLTGEYDGTIIGGTVSVCPSVATQPVPVAACASGSVTFSVAASGSVPFTYAWRKGGMPINTAINPSAATATLSLTNVSAADAGSYDCVVSNLCSGVTSDAATLTVFATGGGDGNIDGSTNGRDIQGFVNALFGGGPVSQGYCAYDLNGDGVVNLVDLSPFVGALLGP
jgi:hypothetical protein